MQTSFDLQIKKLLPLALLIFLTFCFAKPSRSEELEIVDPMQKLLRLPGQSNNLNFSQEVTCGEQRNFYIRTGQCKLSCEFGNCEVGCSPWNKVVESTAQVDECTPESAVIFFSQGRLFNILEADYSASSHSLAIPILKAISQFIEPVEKIRIEQVFYPVVKGFIANGEMRQVALVSLHVSIFPDRTKEYSTGVNLLLDLNQRGLDQLMCLASDGDCNSGSGFWIKRKGLVNANF